MDRQSGFRDRRTIPPGELFCLRTVTALDRAYASGYDAGQRCDMSNGRPKTSDVAWAEYLGRSHERSV